MHPARNSERSNMTPHSSNVFRSEYGAQDGQPDTPSFHFPEKTFTGMEKKIITDNSYGVEHNEVTSRVPSANDLDNPHSIDVSHYKTYRPLLFATTRPTLAFVSQIHEEPPAKTILHTPSPVKVSAMPGSHFDDYTLMRLAGVILGQYDSNRSNYVEKEEVGQMMAHGYETAKPTVGSDQRDRETYISLHDGDSDKR